MIKRMSRKKKKRECHDGERTTQMSLYKPKI